MARARSAWAPPSAGRKNRVGPGLQRLPLGVGNRTMARSLDREAVPPTAGEHNKSSSAVRQGKTTSSKLQ
jgi:hypothetical protein